MGFYTDGRLKKVRPSAHPWAFSRIRTIISPSTYQYIRMSYLTKDISLFHVKTPIFSGIVACTKSQIFAISFVMAASASDNIMAIIVTSFLKSLMAIG